MKLLQVIALTGLLFFATSAFAQDAPPQPEKQKPAISEKQGGGFHNQVMQQGWNREQGPRGPQFRGGRGPQGPMNRGEFREGRGQGKGPVMKGGPKGGPKGPQFRGGQKGPQFGKGKNQCKCPCHQRHGKFGPRHLRGR